MKTILVIVVVLFLPGLVFGQLDPDPDGIGIYFDYGANETCKDFWGGTMVGFLVITNPSIDTGISGWRCHVDYIPEDLRLNWLLKGSMFNISEPPNFVVGLRSQSSPRLPISSAVVVASFSLYLSGPHCIRFRVRESDPVFIFPAALTYTDGLDSSVVIPLHPAAGDVPNASLNCEDCDPAVPNEVRTWGRVKALYR